MPKVKIINLTKKFKSQKNKEITALDKVDLVIKDKQYNTLLGPSGCGKTTLLRIIAGLLKPTRGKVLFDKKNITECPAQNRNIGFVFQHFAIFPHLDVWHNVSYGPVVKGWPEKNIKKATKKNLKLVGLLDRANALPKELSGGMQQRLGLARALATQSKLLLLDEPLSALDAKIGTYLRYELKKIVKKNKLTAVHVTHNQEEAITISDNIILMRRGKIIQTGSPEELYENPNSIFVANFLGKCNFFKARRVSDYEMDCYGKIINVAKKAKHEKVVLGIRPEKIHLREKIDEKLICGKIELINFLGHLYEYRIDVNGHTVKAYKRIKETKIKKTFKVGDKVSLLFYPEDVLVFEEPEEFEEELSLE